MDLGDPSSPPKKDKKGDGNRPSSAIAVPPLNGLGDARKPNDVEATAPHESGKGLDPD